MTEAFICDAVRTPVGRYGGALARNVARMSGLLAGLPIEVGGATVNRLCGSGMEATAQGARAIRVGEADLVVTGGVESMSRAPFVMAKADSAFSRNAEIYDTTIGWRFVNPKMEELYGVDAMGDTAENLAEERQISREDQDRFALWSQHKTEAAQKAGRFAAEIVPVRIAQRRGDDIVVATDEHPRHGSTMDDLAKLRAAFRKGGSVTAGNASGVNDGAAALLLASEAAAKKHGLAPRGRIVGAATAGVPPRIMGIGPAPATRKVLEKIGLTLADMDVLEFNEAFAAQALACTRELGLADDDPRINPNGGAIALGHPLGMSGARLITAALYERV